MHAHAHVPITNEDDDITFEFSTYDILAGLTHLVWKFNSIIIYLH